MLSCESEVKLRSIVLLSYFLVLSSELEAKLYYKNLKDAEF